MSVLLNNAPLPMTDPIARPRRRDEFKPSQKDPLEGLLSDAWADYLSRLAQNVQASATRVSSSSPVNQAGSIAATDVSGGALKAGLYRLSYYARITQAATVSSSLDVTISWTDGGVAQSQTGASITGNTVTTFQSVTLFFHSDASAPISFSTVYTSVGATPMQYRLDVTLEVIDA